MQLNNSEKEKFKKLLYQWQEDGLLSSDKVNDLKLNIDQLHQKSSPFDWKNLSFLAFFFAVVCIILATSLMITGDWLEKIVNAIFDVPDILKSLFFFIVAGGLSYLAKKRRERHPKKVFSNESLFMFGAISVAFGITYLGFSLDMTNGYYPVLILTASVIYGAAGIYLNSAINWYLSMAAFTLWFGSETTYWAKDNDLFIGMNYPMRYVLFGLLLLLLSKIMNRLEWEQKFVNSAYVLGLLSLFMALWLLSIFGNYADLIAWREVSQFNFILWALVLALASAIAIYYGLKHEDKISRDIGILFLLLNIYTRYFEYLWDSMHKVLFFSILAVSFWLIGRKAESVWNLADK
ncbi:hypothetical protein PZB74_18325 [Porifericola rhodea]|uniref:hypothetical protein n=1 Tax=Porifericola rhodea TaxID=930972 RepID=UPI002666E915|nr:hypothetical protein [Porifericola rhodea]WKN30914.1 hypothetical protein PZB74_18325 [Porifericola rhodea]